MPTDTFEAMPADCPSAKDEVHWWTAYGRHSAVDGTDRAAAPEPATPPTQAVLATWWSSVAAAPTLAAVVDDPLDAALQFLVSGRATRGRQEMMVERLGAPSRSARARRRFFRRSRAEGAGWGCWQPF